MSYAHISHNNTHTHTHTHLFIQLLELLVSTLNIPDPPISCFQSDYIALVVVVVFFNACQVSKWHHHHHHHDQRDQSLPLMWLSTYHVIFGETGNDSGIAEHHLDISMSFIFDRIHAHRPSRRMGSCLR